MIAQVDPEYFLYNDSQKNPLPPHYLWKNKNKTGHYNTHASRIKKHIQSTDIKTKLPEHWLPCHLLSVGVNRQHICQFTITYY
jgi:hypothetical protein